MDTARAWAAAASIAPAGRQSGTAVRTGHHGRVRRFLHVQVEKKGSDAKVVRKLVKDYMRYQESRRRYIQNKGGADGIVKQYGGAG